jgi:CRP/FNR family cyclic AMP-dependent transcriptional regulator
MPVTVPVASDEAIENIIDFIANVPLFDMLKDEELSIVAKNMNLLDFSKDEIIWNEWDKGDFICFVVAGKLNVLKRCSVDTLSPMASLERGKSIGELSIVERFPRSATLKASTDAVVVTLSRDTFELILKEHTEIGIKILKSLACLLSHNLRKTSSRLDDYMMPMS